MKDLEKLVQAFANNLYIKSTTVSKKESVEDVDKEVSSKSTYLPASEETREAFKEIMAKHLDNRLSRCEIGSSVTYDYSIGRIRGARLEHKGAFTIYANQNLLDIFESLPELAEGEEYAFLSSMAASVKVTGFNNDELTTTVEKCSVWVANTLAAM